MALTQPSARSRQAVAAVEGLGHLRQTVLPVVLAAEVAAAIQIEALEVLAIHLALLRRKATAEVLDSKTANRIGAAVVVALVPLVRARRLAETLAATERPQAYPAVQSLMLAAAVEGHRLAVVVLAAREVEEMVLPLVVVPAELLTEGGAGEAAILEAAALVAMAAPA